MNDLKAEDTSLVLRDYHNVVKERSQLTWNNFLTMFRQSLLNQFIILVCYDSLCRTMADSSIGEMVEGIRGWGPCWVPATTGERVPRKRRLFAVLPTARRDDATDRRIAGYSP